MITCGQETIEMPHVDASLQRGKAVPARRTTTDSKTTRHLRCRAALAFCAALVACSSEGADNNEPLDESMASTGTIGNTSATATVNTAAGNTVTSTSFGVANSTTSAGPTTGGLG